MNTPRPKFAFILPSLDKMIILTLKKKINAFSKYFNKSSFQKTYSSLVSSIDFSKIVCPCSSNSWDIHAYYDRNISFCGEKIKVRILRIKCRHCGKTHAVLIEDMIPYSSFSGEDFLNMSIDNSSMSYRDVSYYRSKFSSFSVNKYNNFIFRWAGLSLLHAGFSLVAVSRATL